MLGALASGACASAAPPRKVVLGETCRHSVDALDARLLPSLPPGQRGPQMDFADIAQCVLADGTRVPAALFDLRPVSPPMRASVTLEANPHATLATSVTLLDGGYKPIRRMGFEQFARRGDTYTLDVFVNAADRGASYLLLLPDAAWVGKSDASTRAGTTAVVVPVGLATFAYRHGFEAHATRRLTDAGRLRIELAPVAD